MGMVTSIELTKTRAAVYVDGVLMLRVRRADFDALPLAEGDDVDEQAYTDRLCARQMKAAYESALNTLDKRDITAAGMVQALTRRGYLTPVAEAVAARLTANGLIDDKRYAEHYIQRKTATPTGRYALRRGLRQRGIDERTVDDTMALVDDEAQLEAAKALCAQLMRRYAALPAREARAKLSQALARRGFGWDTISEAVESLSMDDDDLDE